MQQLLNYYTKAPIRFTDAFETKLEPNVVDRGRCTARGLSGIVVPISGSGNFYLNGTKYELNNCTYLHAGPNMGIQIEVTSDEPFTYIVLHYVISNAHEYTLHNQHFKFALNESSQILSTVFTLFQQISYPGDFSKLRCQTLFVQFIEQLLVHMRSNEKGNEQIIEQIIKYMHSHFQDGLTVAQILSVFHIESRTIPKRFQQYTGLTIMQYLIELRIKQSRELLRSTSFTITEIGRIIGYDDPFYFSRIFKKNTGVSPREYRQSMLGME